LVVSSSQTRKAIIRVLIVEDDPLDAELLQRQLSRAGFDPYTTRVDTAADLLVALTQGNWDVVTSDHSMPQFNAAATLRIVQGACPETPVIIVSGEIDIPLATSLIKQGASDYVPKTQLALIGPAIESAFQHTRSRREKELAENKLHEATEELESFFALAIDLLCIADLDGYFRRVNKQFEVALGYKREELEGKRFLDLVHPEDLQSTLEVMEDLGNDREVLNFVNRYRCADGTYKWIEWRSRAKGELVYASARDVTDRVLAERIANDSAERYRELYGDLRDGFVSFDPEGKIEECNEAFASLLGYRKDQVLGLRSTDIAHAASLESEEQALGVLRERGYSELYEMKLKTRQGSEVDVEMRVYLRRNRRGEASGRWAVVRGIGGFDASVTPMDEGFEHQVTG
jgi:PAS domain S-box-containing protein